MSNRKCRHIRCNASKVCLYAPVDDNALIRDRNISSNPRVCALGAAHSGQVANLATQALVDTAAPTVLKRHTALFQTRTAIHVKRRSCGHRARQQLTEVFIVDGDVYRPRRLAWRGQRCSWRRWRWRRTQMLELRQNRRILGLLVCHCIFNGLLYANRHRGAAVAMSTTVSTGSHTSRSARGPTSREMRVVSWVHWEIRWYSAKLVAFGDWNGHRTTDPLSITLVLGITK